MKLPIPCLFYRSGTSRGPYFHRADLPTDEVEMSRVLLSVMGSGHPLQIDGVGGGSSVTSKVAIVSQSDHEWAEVDYLFAQVSVLEGGVDYGPSCGNMLAAVGPFAIEEGLVPAAPDRTSVRVCNTNTGALIELTVQTPHGRVIYDGETVIDGVPGAAAPIGLDFMNVVGSKTGQLFPTGQRLDRFDEVEVTCMDVAVPMVFARASDFSLSGYESREQLDANLDFLQRLESIRTQAGEAMGLGDVSAKVVPKFALLAPPRGTGAIAARYFVPTSCHPSYAVTGAICTGSCLLASGTVGEGMAALPERDEVLLEIEHPSGSMAVQFQGSFSGSGNFHLERAGTIRTARKIWKGEVFLPDWTSGGSHHY